MDSSTQCAFNLTRDTALSFNVTVANPTREYAKIIKVLVDGLGSGLALWLNPLSGPAKVPRLCPCEVVYLDRDLRVIQGTPPASSVDRIQSALLLPIRTMISAKARHGDQLIVCNVEELAASRQRFSPADSVASESRFTGAQDFTPAPANTDTEATTLDNSRNTEPPGKQVPQSLDATPAVPSFARSSESPAIPPRPPLSPPVANDAIESSTGKSHRSIFARTTPAAPQSGNQFTLSQSPAWQIANPTVFNPRPVSRESTTDAPETSSVLRQSAHPVVEPDAQPRSGKPPASATPIPTSPAETASAKTPVANTKDEGPRFFSPTPVKFFDPAAEPSVKGDSTESPNGRRSNHFPPELQAAILQITEQQKEKGRDRDSLIKNGSVKSKAARDRQPGKERTAPKEPTRKPPIAEAGAAKSTSLATRLRRWFGAGRASATHNSRRSIRFSPPCLVAYHWSAGEPKPYQIGDISDSGFYLLTTEPSLPHAIRRMTLQRTDGDKEAPGQSISVLARAVRSDGQGVGYEFIMTKSLNRKNGEMLLDDGADRRALARYLQPLMELSSELPDKSAN